MTRMSTLHVWEKVELELEATGSFGNPYTDVTVWVDLEGPDFKKRCYGFWDGGNRFLVRVTAPASGSWAWTSGSSPKDPGLSGKTGSFEATAWSDEEKEQNPCRHGFLMATGNGHAFQYADETPCFLLGDTWWAMGTHRFPWHEGDTSQTPKTFPFYVELRRSQGYNCVAIIAALPHWGKDGGPGRLHTEDGTTLRAGWAQVDTGQIKSMHDEEGNLPFHFPGRVPGHEDAFPDLDRINPDFFRGLDRKIDYLNANGIMPFIEATRRDIGQGWKRYHDWPTSYTRFIQYVFARYQANNALFSPIHYDNNQQSIEAPDWNQAANAVIDTYGPPPFGTPVGCNPHGTSLMNFGHSAEARWLTFHQAGNMRRDHYSYSLLTDLFNSNPAMPAINGEPQYEGMETIMPPGYPDWTFGDVRYEPSPSEEGARIIRSAAYGNVLSGGIAGHIYGAGGWTHGGVWRGDIEDASPVRVWDAMEWPGGAQMGHLVTFMLSEGRRYADLVPNVALLDPNRMGAVASYEGWAYCASTPRRDLVLIYLEKDTPETAVTGLSGGCAYTATWFDPRTGEWGQPAKLDSDHRGGLILPDKPSEQDWALKLVIVE
jgi:hypothetical protein